MASIELKEYRTESGVKTALVRVNGPKWLQYMIMKGPLTIHKAPRSEEKYMSELLFKKRPYPLKRALRTFRLHGKRFGINKAAKRFLTEATKQELS